MPSLNPLKWFQVERKGLQGRALSIRESQAQGPWTSLISDYVAREVAPGLYEALREAVPVIDAAINRMVTLDGIIRVNGENEHLVKKIRVWMKNVQVNDLQTGFQAFYSGMGNELYEQGFSIGEPVMSKDKRSIAGLRVADSKGVIFRRTDRNLETWYRKPTAKRGRMDGTDQVERVLRNNYNGNDILSYLTKTGFKKIEGDHLVYAGLHNEADNPYGVSLLRSMEFVSKVLLTIDNATLHSWERFGDPVFDVVYKTKSKLTPEQLETRRKTIADNIKSAMESKISGKAVDFVNAIGVNDELTIKVLGGEGQVLEIEQPAKHILEQIVAKTGLPPWILGYVWGTAERLALKQAELLMQESKTRFELRQPGLEKIVAMHLRAQGETWNDGDWYLEQELPNMQDVVAQAQADFLRAQTALMNGNAEALPTVVDETGKIVSIGGVRLGKLKAAKALDGSEPFAENDDQLPKIEKRTIKSVLSSWQTLQSRTFNVLGLSAGKSQKSDEPMFVFDVANMLQDLVDLENAMVADLSAEDADYVHGLFNAWLRGMENGAAELGVAATVTEQVRSEMVAEFSRNAMQQVRNTTIRSYSDDIIDDMKSGVYDGLNPKDVARQLKKRFEIHNYDWVRLTRSELTVAHADGKMNEYAEMGVGKYNYVTAGDSKVSAKCRANEAGGPYQIGAGPLPMRDSHPNCRCTVAAVVDE